MLVIDRDHPTPHGGWCRVRIYERDQEASLAPPVVIATEYIDNPGQSITNAAEVIAAEVIHMQRSFEGLEELQTPFIWIEHYLDGARGTPGDPETFDEVTFSHYEPAETR
jgi:hypothetical protein